MSSEQSPSDDRSVGGAFIGLLLGLVRLPARLIAALIRLPAVLVRAMAQRAARRELEGLDDRLLKDIGISRGQIPNVVSSRDRSGPRP